MLNLLQNIKNLFSPNPTTTNIVESQEESTDKVNAKYPYTVTTTTTTTYYSKQKRRDPARRWKV
jgi:hypothetical protein